MVKEILDNAIDRMKKTEAALIRELGSIRAGRANASLLDRIEVEYYGTSTPVNQLASITIPETVCFCIAVPVFCAKVTPQKSVKIDAAKNMVFFILYYLLYF